MEAFSVEQSILEGEREFKDLFTFIRKSAEALEAYEIEKEIFSRVVKIGLCAMRTYFAEKGSGDVGDELEIEKDVFLKRESCLRGRDYFSVFGKLKVPRTCYRKAGMEGVMPLDAKANLPERCYSYLLQEWMDLFSLRDTFGEAEVSLEKLSGLEVKQSRFEIVSRDTCKNYEEFYDNKEVPPVEKEGEIQVLGYDGKGVPMIKREAAKIKGRLGKGEKRQKKKEAFVGVSYTVDKKERTPEEVAENLVYPEEAKAKKKDQTKKPVKGQNIRRLASLARPKEEVMDELISDAKARDPEYQRPWVVLMDGALHLWDMLKRRLAGIEFVGILDIIHVIEYLWGVANALYGEKSEKGQIWVHDHLLSILKGRIGRVIGGLKQISTKQPKLKAQGRKALKDAITYFENHRSWMQYDEYLEAGYPIGTGVVESSCAHVVKNRMEGTGRRWSIEGAEAILLLRSVYTSGDWNAYWEDHRGIERKHLYGKQIEAFVSQGKNKKANSKVA